MMKNIIENIKFDLYLVLLAVLTFLSYLGYLTDYIIPLFVVVGVFAIFTRKKVIYILPIIFFVQMAFNDLSDDKSLITLYSFFVGALVVIDFIYNRKFVRLGVMTIPLGIFSILAIITAVNTPDLFTTFEGWIQITTVLVVYLYLVNTIDDDEVNFSHIAKIFMYISFLVTVEMLHFVVSHDLEPIEVIRRRLIDLGGVNLNLIIYTNILAIPLMGYVVLKAKVKLPYMLIALISATGILLTLSRSSIFTLAVYVVILVPVILYLEKNRLSLIIQGFIFFLLIAIGLYFLEQQDIVSDYFNTLFARDFGDYDNRFDIWLIAWDKLKEFPIFGSGGLYTSRYFMQDTGIISYHNIFAQASTLGILGIGALIYTFYIKTKMIISRNSDFIWFALILIYITAFVNGFLQPMYFNSAYMNYIFIIIASIEVYSNTKKQDNKDEKED
ncbi:MAG: O-Antigen ligase [Candidatus Izimaplasma bacterium HR2]|nr:MAG: O-Antigen ligase [Candidatus Izimaplasma bacterium HR2]